MLCLSKYVVFKERLLCFEQVRCVGSMCIVFKECTYMLYFEQICWEHVHYVQSKASMMCVLSKYVVFWVCTFLWENVRCFQSKYGVFLALGNACYLCSKQVCCVLSKYIVFGACTLCPKQVRYVGCINAVSKASMLCFEILCCVSSKNAVFWASMLYWVVLRCI